MAEQVNHPAHYNSHPNGIECIDIIRHYTCDIANAIKYLWRAGLKPEMGKDDADKEIEDLKKALWYIEDYRKNCPHDSGSHVGRPRINAIIREVTGHSITDIVHGYVPTVATAIGYLLGISIVRDGMVRRVIYWQHDLDEATKNIQERILDINQQLIDKDIQDTKLVLQGCAVEGMDYVAKPGGNRETEPDDYDPLNLLIIYGRAYCLTDKLRKRNNGTLFTPCENCHLKTACYPDWDNHNNDNCRHLCDLHFADTNQYYHEVGTCKYAPSFGTIEVVDEHKELQKELREMKEEEEL